MTIKYLADKIRTLEDTLVRIECNEYQLSEFVKTGYTDPYEFIESFKDDLKEYDNLYSDVTLEDCHEGLYFKLTGVKSTEAKKIIKEPYKKELKSLKDQYEDLKAICDAKIRKTEEAYKAKRYKQFLQLKKEFGDD